MRTMTLPAPNAPESPQPALVEPPLIRLPLWKMSTLLLGAPKLILFAAAGLAVWMYPNHWRAVVASEFWAAFSLYTGVGVGLAFLWRYRPRPSSQWRFPVMVSRGIRLATTLGLAFGFSVIFHFRTSERFKTSGPFFWWTIAIASVLIMVTDLLVVRKSLGGRIGLVPGGDS